jgi:hypothetical protein
VDADGGDGYIQSGQPGCDGCRKLALDCTFDYIKKKPGRKNA